MVEVVEEVEVVDVVFAAATGSRVVVEAMVVDDVTDCE